MPHILQELKRLCEELDEYYIYRLRSVIGGAKKLTRAEEKKAWELHDSIAGRVGAYKDLITSASGVPQVGQEDIWIHALTYSPTPEVASSLNVVIQATKIAHGKIDSDVTIGRRDVQTGELLDSSSTSGSESSEMMTAKVDWKAIRKELGVTRTGFGRRIAFVKDPFRRKVVLRDVEQAFVLASSGYSKPAVILAGGVIEELLRLYLAHKGVKPVSNSFVGYIQTCEQEGLLKAGISRLSDSVRHHRNLVHLSVEETARHTISKSTAKGAVSSIFTIANDF